MSLAIENDATPGVPFAPRRRAVAYRRAGYELMNCFSAGSSAKPQALMR